MKLETSEEEREAFRLMASVGSPGTFVSRLLRDFDTLLAEVERLKKEYELAGEQINELETEEEASSAEIARLRAELDRAPPLPAEVEEMRKSLLSYAANIAAADDMPHLPKTVQAMRDAASLLSRWPGGWRPIETVPKDAWPCCILESAEGWVGEAWFSEDSDGWWMANTHPTDAHDGQVLNPTGWMPLPAPGAAP